MKKFQAAKAEVARLWDAMCIAEGVSVHEKFVVFSPTNPHSKAYNTAVTKLFRLRALLAQPTPKTVRMVL